MATKLKDFRRSVSLLKKQGLLGKAKIDARKAKPDQKIAGKKLSTLVSKFDDVISGKVTAVKVSPSELKKFRKSGFETAQGRLLVHHSKSETAKVQRGTLAITNKRGIERVQIPVEFHNLKQYLTDIKKNAPLIDKMKKRREYFGIRFRGGQRANFYSNIELLIADLERYESIEQARGKTKQLEIYQNLEVLRLTQSGAEGVERSIQNRKRTMSKAYNKRHAKKVRARIKGKSTSIQQHYKDKAAERAREYRARLKRNKAEYDSYLKNSRKRAAKSAKKRKAKKKAKKSRRR